VPRDYARKFAAYDRYRDTGRFQRDYTGFPTILVVTAGPGAENRIAKALSAAAHRVHCRWPTGGISRTIWRMPSNAMPSARSRAYGKT
jgi:hypothetical protein